MTGQGEGPPRKVVLGGPDPSWCCVGSWRCHGDLSAGSLGLDLLGWALGGGGFRRAGGRCGGAWVQLRRNSLWSRMKEATLPTFTLQCWSAPVSAFSLALCWEMEQWSPETTVICPRSHSDGDRAGAGPELGAPSDSFASPLPGLPTPLSPSDTPCIYAGDELISWGNP